MSTSSHPGFKASLESQAAAELLPYTDIEPSAEPEPHAEPSPDSHPEPPSEPERYANPEPFPANPEPSPLKSEPFLAEPDPLPANPEPFPGPEYETRSAAEASPDGAVVTAGVPRNAKECLQAGGVCIPTRECPNAQYRWNQPFKNVCGKEGYDCCFKG